MRARSNFSLSLRTFAAFLTGSFWGPGDFFAIVDKPNGYYPESEPTAETTGNEMKSVLMQ